MYHYLYPTFHIRRNSISNPNRQIDIVLNNKGLSTDVFDKIKSSVSKLQDIYNIIFKNICEHKNKNLSRSDIIKKVTTESRSEIVNKFSDIDSIGCLNGTTTSSNAPDNERKAAALGIALECKLKHSFTQNDTIIIAKIVMRCWTKDNSKILTNIKNDSEYSNLPSRFITNNEINNISSNMYSNIKEMVNAINRYNYLDNIPNDKVNIIIIDKIISLRPSIVRNNNSNTAPFYAIGLRGNDKNNITILTATAAMLSGISFTNNELFQIIDDAYKSNILLVHNLAFNRVSNNNAIPVAAVPSLATVPLPAQFPVFANLDAIVNSLDGVTPLASQVCTKRMFDKEKIEKIVTDMLNDNSLYKSIRFLDESCKLKKSDGSYPVNVKIGGGYKMIQAMKFIDLVGILQRKVKLSDGNSGCVNNSKNYNCVYCNKWLEDRNMFRNVLKDTIVLSDINSKLDLVAASVHLLPAAILDQSQYCTFYTLLDEYKRSSNLRSRQ